MRPASSELDRLLAEADEAEATAPSDAAPAYNAPANPAPARGLAAAIAVLVVLVLGMGAVAVGQRKTATEGEQAHVEAQVSRDTEAQARAQAEAERQEAARSEAVTPRAAAALETTVWANSPGDGFLALRSGPGIGRGTRLLTIPHGDPLAPRRVPRPDDLSRRPLRLVVPRPATTASTGWVFDAFILP